MAPRPILKRASAASSDTAAHLHHPSHQHHQHHGHHALPQMHGVHFPPSPALTRTFSAYSAAAYDRSPIVVSPNSCALPERGCPGRTYTLEEQHELECRPQRAIARARDYHPRALAFASASSSSMNMNMPPVPALVPDLSSESDESDAPSGCAPPDLAAAYYAPAPSSTSSSNPSKHPHFPFIAEPHHHPFTHEDPARPRRLRPASLSLSPTSLSLASLSLTPTPSFDISTTEEDDAPPSPVQPRRRRERRHESSRDPDRIPNAEAPPGGPIGGGASSPPRRKGVRRPTTLVPPPALLASTGFAVVDDGCLGGF